MINHGGEATPMLSSLYQLLMCKGQLAFAVPNVLSATLHIDCPLCSHMHTAASVLRHNAAHSACHYGSTATESIAFAEGSHKASPKHSPRRSPRGLVQTASQQPHLSFEPQAGPSSRVLEALPQRAPSPSLPLQPQPSSLAGTQPPSHSASSAQIDLPTSASSESPSRPHTASAIQPSAEPPNKSSSFNNTADSGMQHQHRAILSQPAQSHQQSHPALSVRTTSQSPAGPPNQELLAGLGSALRAQARLRRKAMAPETASPDERESSVTGNLGEVSPSGQLSFDDIQLKSKGIACPRTRHAQSLCIRSL